MRRWRLEVPRWRGEQGVGSGARGRCTLAEIGWVGKVVEHAKVVAAGEVCVEDVLHVADVAGGLPGVQRF